MAMNHSPRQAPRSRHSADLIRNPSPTSPSHLRTPAQSLPHHPQIHTRWRATTTAVRQRPQPPRRKCAMANNTPVIHKDPAIIKWASTSPAPSSPPLHLLRAPRPLPRATQRTHTRSHSPQPPTRRNHLTTHRRYDHQPPQVLPLDASHRLDLLRLRYRCAGCAWDRGVYV